MPCDEMRDRLSPYLEGELSESERKALEAHLGECADCAALLAVLRESVASLRAAPEADPPPHLARRIQEAVAQKAAEQSRPRTAWGWTWMPWIEAAASFLVMICMIDYLEPSAKATVMIAAKVEQETPRPAPVPAFAPRPRGPWSQRRLPHLRRRAKSRDAGNESERIRCRLAAS
jgi:anti-sigma factor RsiW